MLGGRCALSSFDLARRARGSLGKLFWQFQISVQVKVIFLHLSRSLNAISGELLLKKTIPWRIGIVDYSIIQTEET